MFEFESRLEYELIVSDVCGTDKGMCNVNKWYELESEDPETSHGDPVYTLAYIVFRLCVDDEYGDIPLCDDDVLSKMLMILEDRGFFKADSTLVFLSDQTWT